MFAYLVVKILLLVNIYSLAKDFLRVQLIIKPKSDIWWEAVEFADTVGHGLRCGHTFHNIDAREEVIGYISYRFVLEIPWFHNASEIIMDLH